MLKVLLSNGILSTVATCATAYVALIAVNTTPVVAVSLFNLSFDGTLTGADPLGSTATSEKVKGNFVLDADIPDTSSTPIAGRYDGVLRDLNLTFASTPDRSAVNFSAADFPNGRNGLFIGPFGNKYEEFQFLFGNVASQPPFFQPSSLGIILDSSALPFTTKLKEALIPVEGAFNGQFKLTLTNDQVTTPNNQFSGTFKIARVPEPENIFGLVFLSLGWLCLKKYKVLKSTQQL